MANLVQYFLRVFDPTWKVQFFSAKKDFLKQGCAQDRMLQSRSHHFSLPSSPQKSWNIGPYFWHILVISWSTIHDMAANFVYTKMHGKKWRSEVARALKIEKEIMLFVAHHIIFTSVFPSYHYSLMINIHLVSRNVMQT